MGLVVGSDEETAQLAGEVESSVEEQGAQQAVVELVVPCPESLPAQTVLQV